MVLIFLLPRSKLFNFTFFNFFLYDLFINKVRKLEVAVSNPIIEDISVSFSPSRLGFLSFSFSFTFYLSLFVDSALQLLLCGIMSPSQKVFKWGFIKLSTFFDYVLIYFLRFASVYCSYSCNLPAIFNYSSNEL